VHTARRLKTENDMTYRRTREKRAEIARSPLRTVRLSRRQRQSPLMGSPSFLWVTFRCHRFQEASSTGNVRVWILYESSFQSGLGGSGSSFKPSSRPTLDLLMVAKIIAYDSGLIHK
jgi:hypothetical protein